MSETTLRRIDTSNVLGSRTIERGWYKSSDAQKIFEHSIGPLFQYEDETIDESFLLANNTNTSQYNIASVHSFHSISSSTSSTLHPSATNKSNHFGPTIGVRGILSPEALQMEKKYRSTLFTNVNNNNNTNNTTVNANQSIASITRKTWFVSSPPSFMDLHEQMPQSSNNSANSKVERTLSNPNLWGSWKIRFHGKISVGKTFLVQSLCKLQTSSLSTGKHSETPGLFIRHTLMPIKLEDDAQLKWVMLQLEDVGTRTQEIFKYLQFSEQYDYYHAHVVVFSMTDRDSLQVAQKIVSWLQSKNKNYHIVVVGTKVDDFQNFQITDEELQQFVQTNRTPLCLVSNIVPLYHETQGCYLLVEEVAKCIALV